MSSTLIAGITFSMFAILFYHVSMITCQNAPPPKKKKRCLQVDVKVVSTKTLQ